jgi:DNA-binding PadR family transcriptional regulator
VCIVAVMSVSNILLGLLATEPAHGYTLKRRYDERFSPVKPLAAGQVYASLARFERDGLAVVTGTEDGSGPSRILYAITADGVTAWESWMYTPEPPSTYASSAILIKVTLALLSGRDADAVLDAQRTTHLTRMRELTAARGSATPPDLLALTYELAHLDADLRWIEEAGGRIDQLRDELTKDRS